MNQGLHRIDSFYSDLGRWFSIERVEIIGWALRIVLITLMIPLIQTGLFVPFIEYFVQGPSLDPWASWLDAGGAPQAFPYGHIMLLYHAPFVAMGMGLEALLSPILPSFLIGRGGQIGFALSILVTDYLLYRSLKAWISRDTRELRRLDRDNPATAQRKVSHFLLYFYWLSPLVIYVNYIHGQTDVVPTLLVTLGLIELHARRYALSATWLAVAFSVKASVALIFPFLIFLVVFGYSRRADAVRWLFTLAFILVLWAVLNIALPGHITMVLQNQELAETLRAGVRIVEGRELLLFPLIYGGFLAAMIFMSPLDRWTLYTLTGVALLSIMIVSSTSVGWYFWALPFLLYSVLFSSRRLKIIVAGLWVTVALKDLSLTYELSPGWINDLSQQLMVPALLSTLVAGLTLLLCLRLLQNAQSRNPNYSVVNKRHFIGIAGDSSSGKDTLVDALVLSFGRNRTGIVLGDDYHLYPRGARMWRALTHLNPRANDLPKFNKDIRALMNGESAFSHHYDHDTGTFTRPRRMRPTQITLVNGLHSLLDQRTTKLYDLSIFMDMNDGLRQALKLKRDTTKRGKSQKQVLDSIEARVPDGEAFIKPQRDIAELTFSLKPVNGLAPDSIVMTTHDLNHDVRLCVDVTSRTPSDLNWFASIILMLTPISVIEIESNNISSPQACKTFRFHSAELLSKDVSMLAERTLGPVFQLLYHDYRFASGHRGLMQLITLYELEANLMAEDR